MEWDKFQFEQSKQEFFNVIKYVMPQRTIKKYQNSLEYTRKHRKKQIKQPATEQAIFHQQQKQHAKVQLPTLSQHTFRSTPKSLKSDQQSKISHKKLTNLQSINMQQKQTTEDNQSDKITVAKTQKLNLGLKKNKKGGMKEYMQSILARTKIDEVVTIKRSNFQSNEKQNNSARASSLQHNNQAQGPEMPKEERVQRKVLSQNKIKPPRLPRDRANQQRNKKREQIKLPNVHEHQNLVQMIKQQEDKKRRKKSQMSDNVETQHKQKVATTNKELLKIQQKKTSGRRLEPNLKDVENEIIPEEIQYSSIVGDRESIKQESKNQFIAESIVNESTDQKN